MKYGLAYSRSTKLTPEERGEESKTATPQVVIPSSDNPLLINSEFEWKSHQQTQKLMHELKTECDELVNKSIALAVSYPSTKNHEQIIQNLVRVDTLRKSIENYVK